MKLKVNDLYSLSLGLDDLSEKELPIGLSLKIQRIQKVISEELLSSEEVRQKVIEKYKDKDLGNGQVKIKKEKLKIFNEEIAELMDQEIKIDVDRIDIDALEKAEINIKPQTLMQLESILNAE